MASYTASFERITNDAGLTITSYAGKNRGICNYFKKLSSDDFSDDNCINATLEKCLESAENWSSKTCSDRDVIISLANNQLIELLRSAEDERPKQWKIYVSADVTLRHLDKLRLLNRIEAKVRELNDDANRFLLSDTQYLLHSLMKDSDSPFIFEKIGSRLEHVLIDEFQDTSRIQWQNFKVLLRECMSHADNGNGITQNLIVGDVKQSIYRWRSGDWRLLNNINNEFPNSNELLAYKGLNVNYRSERNIVKFNNEFFAVAKELEYEREKDINEEHAEEIRNAYEGVEKVIPNKINDDGYVKVTLFDDEEYDVNTLNSVIETVDKLKATGVKLSDIAILIRYNKHIPDIARYFMMHRPEYKIISDEAFRLDASMAVNIIMMALRVLCAPNDVLSKASLVITYQRKVLHHDIKESELFNYNDDSQNLDTYLPKGFIDCRDSLLRKPLYDIIEDIYTLFSLDTFRDQSAYICAFYDCVSAFIKENSSNLDAFINYWDETLCSKNIQSDANDGIRLISIHKSKGLEFDNVIIPYCDWKLENVRGNTLWCTPKVEPFNKLPVVPVDYSRKLMDTIYSDEYKDEHLQNTVDNLNLLYVAFTRAGKNLFVYGKKKGERTRSALINDCLREMVTPSKQRETSLKEIKYNEGANDGEPIIFEYGSLYIAKTKEKSQSRNVFLSDKENKNVVFETFKPSIAFKQSNKSRDFIENRDDEDEQKMYIKMGNILHNLFSKIRTTADIDNVIRQLEFDGVLYDDDITAEKMREMLRTRLSDKRVADWFSPHWTLFNECSILYFDHNTNSTVVRRPDRVITDGNEMKVIDFKFGKMRDAYYEQVREYMRLLISMGYKNVSGYLWFVYSNKIECVSLK